MWMKTLLAGVLVGLTSIAASAQDQTAIRPMVGEFRTLSVSNQGAVDQLHRAGWLEARGQVVSRSAFPELFNTIGRSWTADTVSSDHFAVPLLTPGQMRVVSSSDNPYGVLGPGDLVTSGRPHPNRQGPLSCWIFVGRSVVAGDASPR